MNHSIRFNLRIVFAVFVFGATIVTVWAQPIPSNSSAPSLSIQVQDADGKGPLPTPTSASPLLPPSMLQGVISAEEQKKYSAYLQQINDDPSLKEINAKISKLAKEIQQLRMEANTVREKLISANPEIKKIQDKISATMRARSSNGPMPMPMPASGPHPVKTETKP